ncbi:ABC transporter substrate-binding protein [Frankia sp. AgB32]|uniref:ABC transporter substrate-binding protein n=1 Tax=Frankia sp. AgB32 TaxID=631119 RepID=UPI00200E2555|nr:ABC transporter substrate-binding protein [Frankia sp. AgB32]MCK9894530.1 ABC transporter substrate-binding protein [Frankia sp. AgB32]
MVATGCSSSSSGGDTPQASSTAKDATLLGPVSAAKGAPVKVGLITDGKSAIADTSIESTVADATAKYLNEHKAGIGGRPIQLDECLTNNDPSKAVDCANQLIKDKVVAVLIGSSAVGDSVWAPLHTAKIPTMYLGTTSPAAVTDTQSTFALSDPLGALIGSIRVAQKAGLKTVTAVVIDVPAAVSGFQSPDLLAAFKKADVKLKLVAVPPGTADMTPQLRSLAGAKAGVVEVVGNDTFCISAFNGLRAVNFTGPMTAIAACLSDATRKAVPGDVLKRIAVSAYSPVDNDNPSTQFFGAVTRAYGNDIDTENPTGMNTFVLLNTFQAAVGGITGDITPATVIKTIKSAPEKEMPGSGGQKFRCNGKAYPNMPAVCVRGGLFANLNEKGKPASYLVTGASPIES